MKAAPRQHGAAPLAAKAAAPGSAGARTGADVVDEFDALGDGARYATIGDPHRLTSAIVTRRLLILFALVAGLVAACGLTWTITWQHGIDTLRRNAAVRADRTTNALKNTLERYESLPYLLGEHPLVQDVLVAPDA